jgi:hypothetical protein
MRWMSALILCLMCLGCGDATGSKELAAAKPGTDAWIIGKWSFEVVEGSLRGRSSVKTFTTQFWANHSCRQVEPRNSGRTDIDDAAWKISGDTLVIMGVTGESVSGPDMEQVKEALAEYEANPERVKRTDLMKMEDLAPDSFTGSVDSRSDTMKVKATRIKS